jgi:hypothetical protein
MSGRVVEKNSDRCTMLPFFRNKNAPAYGDTERREPMDPRPLLHLEGAAVLTASLLAYHWSHGSWLQFTLLLLLPDLAMLGYLAGVRVGAITYNAVHTYLGPIVLAAYSFESNRLAIFSLSLSHLDRSHRPRPDARIRVEVPNSLQGHSSEPGSSLAVDWDGYLPGQVADCLGQLA